MLLEGGVKRPKVLPVVVIFVQATFAQNHCGLDRRLGWTFLLLWTACCVFFSFSRLELVLFLLEAGAMLQEATAQRCLVLRVLLLQAEQLALHEG